MLGSTTAAAVASGMCANDGDAGRPPDKRRDVEVEVDVDENVVNVDGVDDGETDTSASRRSEGDAETAAVAATLFGVPVFDGTRTRTAGSGDGAAVEELVAGELDNKGTVMGGGDDDDDDDDETEGNAFEPTRVDV